MEIIISVIVSTIVSIFIGNVVGIHYLAKLNNDWEKAFEESTKVTLDAFNDIKNSINH